jgi:site-specific recombinase XerD
VRLAALKRFFKWAVAEEEIDRSPCERLKAPKIPINPPEVLSAAEITKLLKVCQGKDFTARRDTAIIRVLIDTGIRRGELAGLQVQDVDLDNQVLTIRRRKGGNAGSVPIGTMATQALDRYLRVRPKHSGARRLTALWLGTRGVIQAVGIYQMIKVRAREAGITHRVFVHLFRHSFADQWKASGGSEEDLMAIGGWKSTEMVRRYGASAVGRRAFDAHRRLSPGDRI